MRSHVVMIGALIGLAVNSAHAATVVGHVPGVTGAASGETSALADSPKLRARRTFRDDGIRFLFRHRAGFRPANRL